MPRSVQVLILAVLVATAFYAGYANIWGPAMDTREGGCSLHAMAYDNCKN